MTEIKVGTFELTGKDGVFTPIFIMHSETVPLEGHFIQNKGKLYKVTSVLYDADNGNVCLEITDKPK